MPLDRRKLFTGVAGSLQMSFWNFCIVCLCFCLSHSPAHPSLCPIECKCLFSQQTVNCSSRSLKKLPLQIPQKVAILSFHNNKIAGSELHGESFTHLKNLQLLDLSDNRLKLVNLTFSSELSIKILKFDRCSLTEVPIVCGADRMTELYLSHNSITNMTNKFDGWPLLEVLDLSFNRIKILPNNTFRHLTSLKKLDLSKNRIHVIESRALVGLSSLEVLLLSRNRIRDLKNFTHCRTKERSCIGVFANLLHLDFSRNHLSRIDGLTFQGMVKLKTMVLSNNNIATLGDAAFYDLPALTNLQLDNNKVGKISHKWMYNLSNLRNLSLSHNNISVIEPDAWKFSKDINHLNLSSNHLVRLRRDMFELLENMLSLDVSQNLIAVLEDAAFAEARSLRALDLSHNHISSAIEDLGGSFEGLGNLHSLSLRSNSIRFLAPSIFTGLRQLNNLDLTNNNITSIANLTFTNIESLVQLQMDSSSLLCDCKLAAFALWLKSRRNDVTSGINVSCFHPLSLKGRRVMEVKSDQLVCGEHPVPSLLQQPGDSRSLKGENVTLECSASATLPVQKDGLPPSSVNMTAVWRKGPNKDLIRENKSVRIRNVQRPEGSHIFFTSLLLFYNVDYKDEDYYSCMIKNDYGHATSPTAYLRVVTLPRIVRSPKNKTVKYESEVMVDCQAFGHPLPIISWERADGKSFSAADDHRLILNHSLSLDNSPDGSDTTKNVPLHIKPVKPDDAGRYKCTASSDVGEHSAYVDIIVLFPPIIEGMLPEMKAQPGSTTVMKCMASAHPSPTIEWLLNNKSLQQSERHFLAADKQLLVIVDTQVEDQGVYTCKVRNNMGVRRNSTRLTLTNGKGYSPIGDDLWGLPGILLIVLVCVLATSLVWLLYLCCSRKKDDDLTTDSHPHCDVCQQPLDSSHLHTHLPHESFHRHRAFPNHVPDVLPSTQHAPQNSRSYFHSLPRDSRTDVTMRPPPCRSISTECVHCRYAVNNLTADRRPLNHIHSRGNLPRPHLLPWRSRSRAPSRGSTGSSSESLSLATGDKADIAGRNRPPSEETALCENPP